MANQFLSLSLFLMLLSFFIVLNSVSEFEDSKAEPILNSLSIAFTSKVSLKPVAPSIKQTEETPLKDGKKEGDTLKELEGLFNAHIANFTAKRNRFGTVMHVSLPIGRFESALAFNSYDQANIIADTKGAFLPTMITVLRASENGKQYRIDMILNTASDPSVQNHANQPIFMRDMKRITNVATVLEQKGLPKKMISTGLKQGREGVLDLYFYLYKPFILAVEKAEP